jgi:hypothetical protein
MHQQDNNKSAASQAGTVILDLKEILSAPLKKSPTTMVRVAD